MSRIGIVPITIPAGVTIHKDGSVVMVTGPKGSVGVTVPSALEVAVSENVLRITTIDESKNSNSLHGLVRTLLNNAVLGTTTGWEKTLELVGVGYRAAGSAKELTLTIGFSHPVIVTAPENISFAVKDNTKIVISGIDKKIVGEIAAKLRAIRPPEPYKGKGIRYQGEVVRKKAGKAVKAAGAA